MLTKLSKIFLLTVCLSIPAIAQQPTVITSGLQFPTKVITAGQTTLLVAESGANNNGGRITKVFRYPAGRFDAQPLITGLPSALNTIENSRSGPTGLKLYSQTLYVTIGQGDSVITGPRGGTVANPNPVSPLNNSVLEFFLPADYEAFTSTFTLTPAHHAALAAGTPVSIENSQGKVLNVRMLANLPDYRSEFVPGLPQGNVRPANLFGIEQATGGLYVVDASFNQLYKLNPSTGNYSVFATFDPVENPLPFGPPYSEPVPTSVRFFDNKLLVTHLVGFPFAPGTSIIRRVDLTDGTQSTFLGGLTSTMDVLPVPVSALNKAFYVLEFTSNFLQDPLPRGRLALYIEEGPSSSPEGGVVQTIFPQLISPSSMARDGETGDVFVTEIFPGRVVRIPGTFQPGSNRNEKK